MSERPANLPACKHGKVSSAKHPCKECYYESSLIREKVKDVLADYWSMKGNMSVENVAYRAYRLGMKHEEGLGDV